MISLLLLVYSSLRPSPLSLPCSELVVSDGVGWSYLWTGIGCDNAFHDDLTFVCVCVGVEGLACHGA